MGSRFWQSRSSLWMHRNQRFRTLFVFLLLFFCSVLKYAFFLVPLLVVQHLDPWVKREVMEDKDVYTSKNRGERCRCKQDPEKRILCCQCSKGKNTNFEPLPFQEFLDSSPSSSSTSSTSPILLVSPPYTPNNKRCKLNPNARIFVSPH